jgi:dTDP-4-amino-4,6-dideoxygalactose transaminase
MTTAMRVPFLDLDAQYRSIRDHIHKAISEVLDSKSFIQGPFAHAFEKNFCLVHGGSFAVACSNGTCALVAALRAIGLQSGDEVITVPHTFFATVEAIHEAGGIIRFVDVRPDTYVMDVDALAAAVTARTRVVIPVHLYGNTVEMDKLMALAARRGLQVVEDCAQAHLATYHSIPVGTFGVAATFSFFPGKNLGAYGDAGLILASSDALRSRIAMLVNHGRTGKYEHEFLASNYRIDGLQAAILDAKLPFLREWTRKRQELAAVYDRALKPRSFKVIEILPKGSCVYHLYVVEVSNREETVRHLKARAIDTGIHYPIPLHLQPALRHLGHTEGDFPVTERASKRVLSLPLFPELTEEQQRYVIEEFLAVAKV